MLAPAARVKLPTIGVAASDATGGEAVGWGPGRKDFRWTRWKRRSSCTYRLSSSLPTHPTPEILSLPRIPCSYKTSAPSGKSVCLYFIASVCVCLLRVRKGNNVCLLKMERSGKAAGNSIGGISGPQVTTWTSQVTNR